MNAKGTALTIAKGALHVVPPSGGHGQSIVFQFNPDKVRRQIKPNIVGGQPGGHSANVRFGTAPEETFEMQVEIDALDNLPSKAQAIAAVSNGIYPLLNALELLMYPKLAEVQSNQSQINNGTLQVAPYVAPQVLLNWGQKRIVPVVIENYSVEEQLFDKALNPIRASIQLALRVLSYDDVRPGSANYESFISYQRFKENEAEKI